jgi:hypothetical protein
MTFAIVGVLVLAVGGFTGAAVGGALILFEKARRAWHRWRGRRACQREYRAMARESFSQLR